MPELPEVARTLQFIHSTIRSEAEKRGGQSMLTIRRYKPNTPRNPLKENGLTTMWGTFNGVNQHGKLLWIETHRGYAAFHLGMSGYFHADKPHKHDHAEILVGTSNPKPALYFADPRRFGMIAFGRYGQEPIREQAFFPEGIHAMDLYHANARRKAWAQARLRENMTCKEIFMDQSWVAGPGNIYASEILHAVKINPMSSVKSAMRKGRLYDAIAALPFMLERATLAGGTTFEGANRFVVDGVEGRGNQLLKVYGRGGQQCLTCKSARIKTVEQQGRRTYWCPKCQSPDGLR